jgi:molybdate transport system ATP-binding protein
VTPALEARFRVRVGRGAGAFALEAELALERGVLVLFGPSGAGKSLTLRALAGMARPESGFVRVAGETLFDAERGEQVPAHRRRIGWVPQRDSLFPFRSAAENVAFGLPRARRRSSDPEVRALLAELGIAALGDARPDSLSGGERQRVALARALAMRPRLLLLDEPFASVDRPGRVELWRLLRATLDRHATPAVFVTHDSDEALALADRVARYERGRTVGLGPPSEILQDAYPLRLEAALVGDTAAGSLALDGARLVGPAAALPEPEQGRLCVALRMPPRRA